MENRAPILGIIGGLGPMATAHFLELTVQMTLAGSDQEHLEAIIFDRPSTPDRTAYILDRRRPSPLPQLQQSARQLEALGATCLAIPCITAHYFLPSLTQSVSIPVVNALEQTARLLQKGASIPPAFSAPAAPFSPACCRTCWALHTFAVLCRTTPGSREL